MITILQDYPFGVNDYKAMKFNPMEIDKKSEVLTSIPELNRFTSFQKLTKSSLDINKLIRYILLAYDPKSPAVQTIKDQFKRKTWCALAAGFEYGEDFNFSPDYNAVLNCQNDEVNDAILDYLTLFDNPDYMLLVLGYEGYYRKLRQYNNTVYDDKKNDLEIEKTRGELWKQLQAMSPQLRDMANSILNDYNPYLRERLYRAVNKTVHEKLNLTPEARAIQKGLLDA
jgi:hypothetical protein